MTAGVPQALDYGRPSTAAASSPNKALYVALVCALGPTSIGTVALIGWLTTHYQGFEAVGLFTIMGGLVLLPIGLVASAWHLWTLYRTRSRPVRRWLMPAAIPPLLLLGNLPLCAAYINIYESIANRYTVRVVNATPAAIARVVITDPTGQQLVLGPIAPGQTAQGSLLPRGEGAITFSATSQGRQINGVIDGYISDGPPGVGPMTRIVTVSPGGTVTVK